MSTPAKKLLQFVTGKIIEIPNVSRDLFYFPMFLHTGMVSYQKSFFFGQTFVSSIKISFGLVFKKPVCLFGLRCCRWCPRHFLYHTFSSKLDFFSITSFWLFEHFAINYKIILLNFQNVEISEMSKFVEKYGILSK